MIKIALLCGGPSPERGVSLNSIRSVLDHLGCDGIELIPIYFDQKREAYQLSKAQCYSNTPCDFDFKLTKIAKPLKEEDLLFLLRQMDLTFPIIHGQFGEDGVLQSWLEKHKLPFIGSSSKVCNQAFDKFIANEFIRAQGFYTLPSILLTKDSCHEVMVDDFFKEENISRAIVKPADGGSSIGVFSVDTQREALHKAKLLFAQGVTKRVVIEPFAKGQEFTVIILQNKVGKPVSLLPTEIMVDYSCHQFFDFRRKYLPGNQVAYVCPANFSDAVITEIQRQAETLFSLFAMRDFARFDGWLLADGNIWFSDFNPMSGMEQNSFLFMQAARIGMTHRDVLYYIVRHALSRYGIDWPKFTKTITAKKPVHVLFGGDNSERQVSLMSGTNVWLKLRASDHYQVQPYFLDSDHNIWHLPYHLCLNHTVEEIYQNCIGYQQDNQRLQPIVRQIRQRLDLRVFNDDDFFPPKKMTLQAFIDQAETVFIALHGGFGENGQLQQLLTKRHIHFNGETAKIATLCIDKWQTAVEIERLNIPRVRAIRDCKLKTEPLLTERETSNLNRIWQHLCRQLNHNILLVKPLNDGCSAGVVRLSSMADLAVYLDMLANHIKLISPHSLAGQQEVIEMPEKRPDYLLFQPFIATDQLSIENDQLSYQVISGWLELTIAIIYQHGKLIVLEPSITLNTNQVLSLAEKFQGGSGVNITPPPTTIISEEILTKIKAKIAMLVKAIGFKAYARIDFFVEVKTASIQIIEINTLPALTPSTVFFHQALARKQPMYPLQLLEGLLMPKAP